SEDSSKISKVLREAINLTVPANENIPECESQADVNTAFANWLAGATFSGDCSPMMSNNNTGPPSSCGGSTTVTWTVVNSCDPAEVASATFTVTTSSPVILTVPSDETIPACESQADV